MKENKIRVKKYEEKLIFDKERRSCELELKFVNDRCSSFDFCLFIN